MPRGIPRVRTEPVAESSVAVATKPRIYICIEAFNVTVYNSLSDEKEALHYGAMPQAELHKLVEDTGLQVPRGEDMWFKVGQRVHESHRVFQGESGENRKRKLFISEEDA